MIILNNNNNANVNIPDYDDLVNKPSINGVVLEGNKTTAELGIDIDTTNFYTKREVNERIADSITGIENEFGNYYTKTQSDSNYQPKGNYLTEIPSEYVTESELSGKNYATKSEIPTIPTNISSFTNDSGYITINALSGYATESWVGNHYQTKGNYLTSIPSEYITETELNDAIAGLGGSESVAYLIIEENASENTFNYVGGSFEDVVNAYNNNKPYFIYVPNSDGAGWYSLAETTNITDTYIQCSSFVHTGVAHTWRYFRLYSDSPTLYYQTTYEYATKTWVGNHYQTKGNYATTSYVDTQIGNINTILENILN